MAVLVGLSDVTVRTVLHRWRASGPGGVIDGRKGDWSEPRLTARRRNALYAAPTEAATVRQGVGRPRRWPGTSRPVAGRGRAGDRVAVAPGPRVHLPSPPT